MDVRLPDGTIVKNVPEGTTRKQVVEKLQKAPDQSFYKRAVSAVSNAVSPPREDIPEAPYIYQGADRQSLDMYRQNVDPTAQAVADQYGNTVWEGDQGRVYPDRPGFTLRDIPQFQTDATQFLQDAAPFIAGGSAVAPMRAAPAMASMAGIGGAASVARESAKEVTSGDGNFAQVPVDMALSALGEGGARVAFRVLRPVFTRMFGKSATNTPIMDDKGQFTQHGMRLLKIAQQGDNFDEVLSTELSRLQSTGTLTAEQAKRFNAFRKHGLSPTRAEVTRTATDFQNQQEAFKRSGAVRTAMEQTDEQIGRLFRDMRPNTQQSAGTAAVGLKESVEQADEAVSAAYKAAREAAPDARVVRVDDLVDTIRSYLPDNAASGGVVRSLVGELKRNGVQPGTRISVAQAEKIRQQMNNLYDPQNGYGNQLLRSLKQRLDDAVTEVAPDVFAGPRRMKADLESSLNRARVSRRDARSGQGFVRDVVNNKVDPNRMVDTLKRATTRADDIGEFRAVLPDDAWEGVKASVVDDMVENIFKGPQGETGAQATSRYRLENWVNRWGRDKLGRVFTEDEMGFLDDMSELLSYREPVSMTQQGKGPSAQGMKSAVDAILKRIPKVGDWAIDAVTSILDNVGDDRLARAVMNSMADDTAKVLTIAQRRALLESLRRQFTPVGGVASGSVVAEGQN